MLIPAAVFVSILVIILGAYWLFVLRDEDRDQRKLRQRLKPKRAARAVAIAKPAERMSALGPLDALLSRSRQLVEPVGRMIDQSGLPVTLGTVVLASVFAAVVVGGVAMKLTSLATAGFGAGAAAACLPFLYVRRRARRRLAKFEEQFPEAIDLVARSLRAGHALPTALEMVGTEIPAPVGREFKQLFEQQNYGLSLPDALREFARRVPILDARFFVSALLTQRETGGNLSEVLDKLASVIRERFKVKRQVRVLSAHGRITGWVLGFLPPAVGTLLFIISPEHMRLLIDDPLGVEMVVTAVVLQIIGVLAIRRIVDVEY